jgi:flagellar basal body-associated protein FliL
MDKKRIILITVGVVLGAIAGYLYYFYIGCSSGSCAITSKPLNSTLYGMFMGGLLLDMVNDYTTKKEQKE